MTDRHVAETQALGKLPIPFRLAAIKFVGRNTFRYVDLKDHDQIASAFVCIGLRPSSLPSLDDFVDAVTLLRGNES